MRRDGWMKRTRAKELTGVVISAAKSSRCSAASFARRRAARARARGVVRSCGTGNDLHVGVGIGIGIGVNVGLLAIVLDSETRSGFGVVRAEDADVDAEMRVDTAREAEGAKDGKAIAASDDIFVIGTVPGKGTVCFDFQRQTGGDDDDDDDDNDDVEKPDVVRWNLIKIALWCSGCVRRFFLWFLWLGGEVMRYVSAVC